MGDYSMDLSNEKQPNIKKLIPEGWQSTVITNCEEKTSKAGNQMFVVELTFKEYNYSEDVFLVATKGKRWQLKKLLGACNCKASKDGIYSWSISDILNKEIRVLVSHEDNIWINRSGDTVKNKQNKFTDFETISWDENE